MLLWTSCTVTTNFVNGKIWSLLTAQNVRPHLCLKKAGKTNKCCTARTRAAPPPLLRDAKL